MTPWPWRTRGHAEDGPRPAGPAGRPGRDGHPRGEARPDRGGSSRRDAGPDARPVTHPALVDGLAAVIALAGLALLAPLEWHAGRWLGLGPAHAITITVVIEGCTALAIAAGRLVWPALTLTAGSALLGLARSAAAQAATDHQPVTRERLAAAAGVTALAVAALALTHIIRRDQHARAAAARAAAQARADHLAAEQRAHQLALADAERQRLADEHAAAERTKAAERAHVLELQRTRAYAEDTRTRADLERARLADQRAADDAARTDATRAAERTHQLALAEMAARASTRARTQRAHDDGARPPREHGTVAVDDLAAARAYRERAREQWEAREGTGTPMTGAELAQLLGVHESTGRRTAEQWRAERARAATGGVR